MTDFRYFNTHMCQRLYTLSLKKAVNDIRQTLLKKFK